MLALFIFSVVEEELTVTVVNKSVPLFSQNSKNSLKFDIGLLCSQPSITYVVATNFNIDNYCLILCLVQCTYYM